MLIFCSCGKVVSVAEMGSNLDRVTENAGILPLGIYKQIKASEISLVI